MTVHHLNLARPSPDRIIEANRRDWFDAHCDYVATGDARYRPGPWLRRRAALGLSLRHAEPALG